MSKRLIKLRESSQEFSILLTLDAAIWAKLRPPASHGLLPPSSFFLVLLSWTSDVSVKWLWIFLQISEELFELWASRYSSYLCCLYSALLWPLKVIKPFVHWNYARFKAISHSDIKRGVKPLSRMHLCWRKVPVFLNPVISLASTNSPSQEVCTSFKQSV